MVNSISDFINQAMMGVESKQAEDAKLELMKYLAQQQQNANHIPKYTGLGILGGQGAGGYGLGGTSASPNTGSQYFPTTVLPTSTLIGMQAPAPLPQPSGRLTTIVFEDADGYNLPLIVDTSYVQVMEYIAAMHRASRGLKKTGMPSGDFSEDEMELAGNVMAEMESKKACHGRQDA